MKKTQIRASFALAVLVCLIPASNLVSAKELVFSSVFERVLQNDFTLQQLEFDSQAFKYKAEAAADLPDPTIFAAFQNLPTDTFELDQEPMTQFRVGIRQMFPKGDSLEIKSGIEKAKSDLQLPKASLRRLSLKQSLENAWIEGWYWQSSLTLLDEDEVFLKQVVDFIQSLYEVGAKGQTDLLGAKLELIKLEEQRLQSERHLESHLNQLDLLANESLGGSALESQLLYSYADLARSSDSKASLNKHPKLNIINEQVRLAEGDLALSYTELNPSWGIEASYGLRSGRNANGSDRPDFLSVGVNFQLPLFSDAKQRQTSLAKKSRVNTVNVERQKVLRELELEYELLRNDAEQIGKQIELYSERLLPALAEQKNSALQEYESDKGTFDGVVKLYLEEQKAKLKLKRLQADQALKISKINFNLGADYQGSVNP